MTRASTAPEGHSPPDDWDQQRTRPRTARDAEWTEQHLPAHNLVTCAKDTRGSNALEYSLIAALLSLAIVAGASSLGGALGGLFNTVTQVTAKISAG
jgi:pilus assembly protein Flp/PilA